ncbi:acyltransferase family protein [Streptomyces sp. NPDC048718]|uniref:acyltransferase family protein n=1 Tax=Streptomyces sp. NPDC048718 TaxID=3365587 RepID=UPI00371F8153
MSAPPSPPSPPRGTHRRTPAASPAGSSPTSRTRHIAALDGLRGVAVLGVLLFHAGCFAGGFLGVDLFFVLSGFLITGLLLKEARATRETAGRIRLAAFWGRRARRLSPALIVMVAGTLLLTWACGGGPVRRQALKDAPWVVANLANWHFIADQAGYWQASATQVFSHLWSIAVEEQFYLVWPLFLVLLVRGGGNSERAERRVAAVAAAGAALSLGLMLVLRDPVDSTRVYEGTDTRAFSLLLGSLAATTPVARLLGRLGDRMLGRCALILGCALAVYWFTADGQKTPGLFQGGLFLHALTAALLIACLAHAPRGPLGRALAAPPLRGLGVLSYSLYLWHWPVYVLLSEDRLGLTGWCRTAVLLAVSLAAAWLSKVLVEDPVRFRAGWAHGRTGAAAFLAALLALTALWILLPWPELGAGSVDLTQLTAADSR